MAREQANINTAIWGDRDWRQLTSPAKYLYMLLLTHPSITYAGVVDWRPAKLSLLSPDTTKEGLEDASMELQRARFVFIDHESEEVLIRSYLRHDGILKQPKLSVSMVNAYASTASHKIQDVVAFELHRLRTEYPDWAAWRSVKVQEVLKNEGANMDSFTLNAAQALPKAEASVCPSVTLNAAQSQGLHTTTATTTTTPTSVGGSGGTHRKPNVALPASWAPKSAHEEYAATEGINVEFQSERFRTHAEANDRRLRDWDAGFRNWLLKAERTTKKEIPHNPLWDP